MLDLYQADLMDRYQQPRFKGVVAGANFTVSEFNPSCGDEVSFTAFIDQNGVIQQLRFTGRGCVISLATADKLAEYLQQREFSLITKLTTADILKLVQIPLGPTRLRCALLPLLALQKLTRSALV
ncbi:MAG TPA: iron-sulfur cluster assembly scaffold protein [Candidatus Babeliales bacterium]|nr:iron-sulfur cluster assembly scaffold protein [Candidatus Babeliales bacterium]